MALPNPLPDNPLKWDGWKNYNSPNLYQRLCLDFASNVTDDNIEENCRLLLVWWQKKLPLKNQPSNPMAQLLRQGLDEAPVRLAQARTKLLDPEERRRIDEELHKHFVNEALAEFSKLLSFSVSDRQLTAESEARLLNAGRRLGLPDGEMIAAIEAELEKTGAVRVGDTAPRGEASLHNQPLTREPASTPTAAAGAVAGSDDPLVAAQPRDPFEEFRRLLRMSRLCLDGEDMTDDQRDAMCNMGESLGLTGGQAEDLIDEYIEEAAALPLAPAPAARAVVQRLQPTRSTPPPRPAVPVPAAQPPRGGAQISGKTVIGAAPAARPAGRAVSITPAARAAERQKYANFTNSVGSEMYLIPSGQIEMGSTALAAQPNEQPLTTVTVSAFFMARLPVTNAQFERFDPSHKSKRAPWADDNHPVIYVTWAEAHAFCRWLSQREGRRYRLPTEAEWEYAARGDDGRIFPWGSELTSGTLANFADSRTAFTWRDPKIDDGYAETAPVGQFPRGASPFGIEEMAGNVFEWCFDWYEPYKGKPLVNPMGPPSGKNRVYRGGSWRSRMSSLRTTARAYNIPAYMGNDVGFRVVCECE